MSLPLSHAHLRSGDLSIAVLAAEEIVIGLTSVGKGLGSFDKPNASQLEGRTYEVLLYYCYCRYTEVPFQP